MPEQFLRVALRVRAFADTGEHARDLADTRLVEQELGTGDGATVVLVLRHA